MRPSENLAFRRFNRTWPWAAATGSGLHQAGIEATRVASGKFPDKFPNGWDSYHFFEEMAEGSLFILTGMFLGKAIYLNRVARGLETYRATREFQFMTMGGVIAWTGEFAIGILYHHFSGNADFRWGPFKN